MSERKEMLHGSLLGATQERRALYWASVRPALDRLLGTLDREPHSLSYGSFDREHWAWKFRDWPITMLQAGFYPLALAWRTPQDDSPFHENAEVLGWVLGALEHTCRRQRRNGAFDSVGPNTQDHGVTLAMVRYLADTIRLLGPAAPPAVTQAVRDSIRRGCQFALQSSEDYAFISNHHALFALAFLSAHELLGEESYREQAARTIEAILMQQSPDGWYAEYGGPDPGYESLGISYLASYWQRTRSPRLLDSLRRSVQFYSHCVHPDGSVGGVYGSRHTQQYYPAGMEILTREIPLAASVARFMGRRLENRNVVTLDSVDAGNLSVLTASYLQACVESNELSGELPPLPCEALDGVRYFPASRITFAGSPRYYAVVNAAKGGVCRVFDKRNTALAYEDAGYLARAGDKLWTSQRTAPGCAAAGTAAHETLAEVHFTEVRQELPTPGKFLLLRLANLTLFRSLALGAWLRRQIVLRLIMSSRPGPLRLTRRVKFEENEISFSDRIEAARRLTVDRVSLVRSFTAIHMGSAKYFHPAEIEETPLPDTTNVAHELAEGRAAICEFRLQFTTGAKPALLSGAATNRAEAAQPEGTLTRP